MIIIKQNADNSYFDELVHKWLSLLITIITNLDAKQFVQISDAVTLRGKKIW